jgi:hypothetical protein
MSRTIELGTELHVLECINCGITFAFPSGYNARLRETHANFYCPNGHAQAYLGKTEAEKLRDQLAKERQQLDQLKADRDWYRERLDESKGKEQQTSNRLRAHKGIVTKLRKRVADGKCPCCHRKFKDLRDHMKAAHPDWNPEKGAESIAEKSA